MKSILACIAVFALSGCASNMENAAEILKDRPIPQCQIPINGEMHTFQGQDCRDIADRALQAGAYRACAEMAESNEAACVVAVALSGQSGQQNRQGASDEVQLMIAAMNNDTRILSAWISQIPIVGTVTAQYFHSKAEADLQDTLQTAFENSGPNIGSMTVTKSDDGTGGEGPGTGGNGDQIINFGQGSGFATGTGAVVSDGRNPAIIAPGQNDSILDPSTVNNQSATAPDNPINNAPVVNPQDNDGGGDNSLIPNPF